MESARRKVEDGVGLVVVAGYHGGVLQDCRCTLSGSGEEERFVEETLDGWEGVGDPRGNWRRKHWHPRYPSRAKTSWSCFMSEHQLSHARAMEEVSHRSER